MGYEEKAPLRSTQSLGSQTRYSDRQGEVTVGVPGRAGARERMLSLGGVGTGMNQDKLLFKLL